MLQHYDGENFNYSSDFITKIEELFPESRPVGLSNTVSGWQLAVDVYENAANLVFVAEIAGIRHQDINITVTETSVNFSGHRNPTCSKSRGFYHRMEIPTGHFSRRFSLPVKVIPNQGLAKVVDGMLYLILPKQQF
ncbi:MAG: Hsp20/alpha crystallin family protein [Desulfarculales bacterium]|jgi:HSP20 family protein|nr:Hsp20/alpha crystallin family protein [Desulfarculales bacterium]